MGTCTAGTNSYTVTANSATSAAGVTASGSFSWSEAGGVLSTTATGSITLTGPPCSWSLTAVLEAAECPGGSADTNHSVAIKVDGVTIDSFVWDSSTGDANVSASGDNAGGSNVSLWVDGVNVGSGVTDCGGDPPPDNIIALGAITIEEECEPEPTPTPTPTPSPTPTPAPTPTPIPTAPPDSTPPPTSTPPPNASPGGSPVTVSNMEDFYDAVKAAVENAASDQPVEVGPGSDGLITALEQDEGQFRDLASKVEQGTEALGTMKTARTGLQSSLDAKVNAIPTSFGSASEIPLGLNAFGFGGADGIQLSAWSTQIHLFRTLMLWLITLSWFVAIYRLFVTTGGST